MDLPTLTTAETRATIQSALADTLDIITMLVAKYEEFTENLQLFVRNLDRVHGQMGDLLTQVWLQYLRSIAFITPDSHLC